jgi:hypothetical protein
MADEHPDQDMPDRAGDRDPAVPSGVGPPRARRPADEVDEVELGSELSFPASDPPSAAAPASDRDPPPSAEPR